MPRHSGLSWPARSHAGRTSNFPVERDTHTLFSPFCSGCRMRLASVQMTSIGEDTDTCGRIFTTRSFNVQGEQGGLKLDFVDFNLGVLPVCLFAMPSLPNFDLPKQNWADRGTYQIEVTKTKCQTTMVTL